jgi:magnesium-transporting ATPase (P-type)
MDSLGALALATESPSKTVMDYPPVHRSASLITPSMLRNVLFVSIYQSVVILCMMFKGLGDAVSLVPDTLFFNGAVGAGDKDWADAIDSTFYASLRKIYRYSVVYNFFILV